MGNRGPLDQVGAAEILRVFDANVLGALRVTKAFLANVEASRQRKIAFVTSMMGSIGDGPSGGYYPYRISKTALNMLGANLAAELKPRGVMVAILHPGWVRTRMGGEAAPTSVEDSVMGMRRVIAGLTPDDSGGFFHAEGHAVPW
jgi:NAD(P)-dependent dehydrogenase (short-subunit alcohol dehydrogenase family)